MISLHPIHHHPSIHSKFAESCISQNTGQSDSQNLFNPPNLSKSAFSQFFWQLTYPTPKITSPKPGKTYVTNNVQIITSFSHTNGYRHFNLQKLPLKKPKKNPSIPIQKGLFGPCGREEHGVSTFWYMLQDPLDLRFKAHVQHTICFIQDLQVDSGRDMENVSICFPWCDRMSLWVGFYDDLGVFQDSFK